MMEFKLRYLNSYAHLLDTYFQNLNFEEIVGQIETSEESTGKVLVLIACMIVDQEEFKIESPEHITDEDYT